MEINCCRENKIEENIHKKNDLTIVIASNLFGDGDEKLGEILMKVYIYALAENKVLPNNLIFMNGGVKLVCAGSNVLDSLSEIREKGVNILSCGTCIDFYGLNEKVLASEIGNMYSIVSLMNESKNTIKI